MKSGNILAQLIGTNDMIDTRVKYTPVLRWKRAEKNALCELFRYKSRTKIASLLPLIELAPKSGATDTQQLISESVEDIFQNWGPEPIFVDTWLLEKYSSNDRTDNIELLLANAMRAKQLSLIPVIHLNNIQKYRALKDIVSLDENGFCLRLHAQDLMLPDLRNRVSRLINFIGIPKPSIDLIIDLQFIESLPIRYNVGELISNIPDIKSWRNFTIIAGAFPKDLSSFHVGTHMHPRLEWEIWESLRNNQSTLPRLPNYGDYTIQHPHFVLHDPNKFLNYSASIRYTIENSWLIMRGEGVFHDGSPGFVQYPAQASLLCDREEYCGKDFSYGDNYIQKISLELEKEDEKEITTGSAESWLKAGINHHMEYVLNQLSS